MFDTPEHLLERIRLGEGSLIELKAMSFAGTKVKGPERATLTTQLYFPGNEGNSRDNYCEDGLLLDIEETPNGKVGHFDFVVR